MKCGCGHIVGCGCECKNGKCPQCRKAFKKIANFFIGIIDSF